MLPRGTGPISTPRFRLQWPQHGRIPRQMPQTRGRSFECGDIEKAWGPDAEVYRCENCKALYLPHPGEAKVNVAGQGMISVFGLTLPPKEK